MTGLRLFPDFNHFADWFPRRGPTNEPGHQEHKTGHKNERGQSTPPRQSIPPRHNAELRQFIRPRHDHAPIALVVKQSNHPEQSERNRGTGRFGGSFKDPTIPRIEPIAATARPHRVLNAIPPCLCACARCAGHEYGDYQAYLHAILHENLPRYYQAPSRDC